MIRVLAITRDLKLIRNIHIHKIKDYDINWYWVDFEAPTGEEVKYLSDYFGFHPLAIEDCLHFLERPKLDYYEAYNFLVLHALNQETLAPEEIDVFVGKNYVVTFHLSSSSEVESAWNQVISNKNIWAEGHTYVGYLVLDKIVDQYFPAIYRIEDYLSDLEDKSDDKSTRVLMDKVFKVRGDLLKLRRIVNSMRDLIYRIINSGHMEGFRENKLYFTDIYDHLLKLSEMIESSREMTSDMRDSYLAIISNRMNKIMMTLTIITTIFIPLSFIAGVYGMNFEYMPELEWRYGYFVVIGVMAAIAFAMVIWFKRKGWFDVYK
ncbi:MAG: magnesium/cobalt transporter CorA [Bacillota bacterium]